MTANELKELLKDYPKKISGFNSEIAVCNDRLKEVYRQAFDPYVSKPDRQRIQCERLPEAPLEYRARADKLKNKIEQLNGKLLEAESTIEFYINKIAGDGEPWSDYRNVLTLKYIEGKTIEDIAVSINYCERKVTSLISAAVEIVANALEVKNGE